MAEIKLSAQGQQKLYFGVNEKTHHYQLKNLGFEESGHTGFQKELTEKQLELIEKVKSKEDVANRVTTISDENTHEQYPSAKAVYDAVNECGEFELIDSAEFTEKVSIIERKFATQYKELYIRFIIPQSMEAAAGTPSTEKARWTVQTLNDGGWAINKTIYNMGNQFIQDFTEKWATVIHIKVLGNYCRTELWYDKNWYLTDGYARGMSSSTYSGYVAPGVTMVRDYIDRIKISFMTANQVADGSVRYLPIGTTYEIWGIRK